MEIKDIFTEYQVPNFNEIKPHLMKDIARNRSMKIAAADGSRIADTNYFTPKFTFPYEETLPTIIEEFLSSMNITSTWDGNCWHQVYKRGDYHNWHTHADTNMSAVFYIQCDEGQGTVFKIGDEEYRTPSVEGTIIAFPSGMLHRTLPHDSDKARVIISFNWNYYGPRDEREI